MAHITLSYEQNLNQPVFVREPGACTFTGDNASTEIAVALVDDNGPAEVSGTVLGYAIRADGSTVALTGLLVENVASVTLPEACFAYPGPLAVSVQVVADGAKTTIFKAGYYVESTRTGTIIDPGSVVPDLSDILAMLDQMEQATEAANAASEAVPAIIAPTFDTSTAYTVGDYVYYSGALYRFTADHAAGAWTGTDAVSVKLAPEVAELKSDFVNYVADVVFNGAGWEQGSVNGLNGEDLESNTVSRTGFLQVTPEKTYTISHNDLNGYILNEFTYNSNCAYIGHLNVTTYNGRRYETNVAFVRFRLEKANSTVTPEIAKGFNIRIYKNDGELFNAIKQTQKLGVMQNFPTDSPATSANAPYNDLDTLPVTSVVVYGLMNGVQHLPDGVTSATIITTNSDNSMSNGAVQLLIDRTNGGILYSRIRAADQWTQWKRALTKSNGVIEFYGNYIYPGGTLSLANAPENATVYVTGDTTYTDKPSFVDSFEGFLTTVVKAVAPQQKYQYFVGRDNGFICYRTYVLGSASWGDWIKVLNQYSLLSATGQSTSVGMTQKAITGAINGVIDNTLVNDKVLDATVNIDNISGNHIGYVLNGRNPGELPIDKAVGWLFTFSTVSVRTQIFYTMYQGNTTYTGGTYMRYYNGTSWGPWRRTDSRKYHCGIASFIDDDTSSEEQVQQYASIFREYGLKCGFACVPMPSATHPEYGYIQDNSFQKTMLRLQDDGFSCLLHCYHQSATQPEYILLDEQPADWESAFDKYFKIVGGQYKQLLATESFSANTYYRANTEFYSEAYRGKSVLLTEKPIDWEWNRYEYYTRTYNLVTSENAPLHWGEATYYQNYYTKSGDIYTQLTSWPVGGYTANTYYTAAHSVVSTYPMPEFEQNIYYTPVCWNPYIVQNNMGLTIRTMQKIGLNGWKYWVIPYGETPRDLRRIAKDHGIECAWIMGGTYSDANLKTDRYRINRYTLNAADAVSDYLSGTPTKLNAVKAMIDTVAQNNGWICFCTHINTWRDSRYIGTQVTADQGFNLTKQFVKAVIEYCLEKGVPVESPIRAYEERKDMFDPMESL